MVKKLLKKFELCTNPVIVIIALQLIIHNLCLDRIGKEITKIKKHNLEEEINILSKKINLYNLELHNIKLQIMDVKFLAESAWDMANPNHSPSQLNLRWKDQLTKEQVDSIWMEYHGWNNNDLEKYKQTGTIP